MIADGVPQAEVKAFLAKSDGEGRVKSYYDSHKTDFSQPEKAKVRHILIRAEKAKPEAVAAAKIEAEKILAAVKGGADFGKLATEKSQDPGSQKSGGLIDYFAKGSMVPEFEKYAFSAKPGEVSDLVQTDFGFHIIKLEDRKPAAEKKPAAKRLSAQALRPAASGPRLELEAAPAVVARAASTPPGVEWPVVAAAAPASAASSAARGDDAAALLALERERIRLLEEGLARLRSDSQATQQALATLQSRLQAAESERYSNPLVYVLAWLSALLALAVGALWWRQSRARGAAQWWAPPAPVLAPAAAPRAKALDFETAPPTTMSGVAPAYEVSMLDPGEISMPAPDLPMTIPAAAALRPAPVVAEPSRELSVEELIDLEQQAEFFVVLGQDEAAIELLMSHVRNDSGISPLPYLKLLEIYKRRGESDAYERIRGRFNRRFNAYAPDWASDLQQGLALQAYPETVQRLQALWASPAKAMETLAAALFRRDASDQTYDLPAYRELLFLYAIARDFQEHGAADLGRDVDLLLPMHDDTPAEPIARLVHSTGFQNSALMTQPLDLDVSLVRGENGDAPSEAASGLARRAHERPAANSGLIDFDPARPGAPERR